MTDHHRPTTRTDSDWQNYRIARNSDTEDTEDTEDNTVQVLEMGGASWLAITTIIFTLFKENTDMKNAWFCFLCFSIKR